MHGGDYPEELIEQVPDDWGNEVEKSFECAHCGDTFTREVEPDQTRTYCSRSCQAKATATGTDPREAKKGARKRALERDDYTCQRCGREVESGDRETAKSAEVHHLIPKMAGGTDHLDNLVTLCYRCHKRAHRKMGKIPENHPQLLQDLRDVVCEEEA